MLSLLLSLLAVVYSLNYSTAEQCEKNGVRLPNFTYLEKQLAKDEINFETGNLIVDSQLSLDKFNIEKTLNDCPKNRKDRKRFTEELRFRAEIPW